MLDGEIECGAMVRHYRHSLIYDHIRETPEPTDPPKDADPEPEDPEGRAASFGHPEPEEPRRTRRTRRAKRRKR